MKSGWAIKKLGEVCELIADGDWIESKDQSTSGIRLVQTGNVGVGVFRNKEGSEHFISSETFKRLNCTEIFGGDILISRLPDPVGRACIVPELEQGMITAVDCSIVRLRREVCLPAFLVYYASSAEWFDAIEAKCTGSTRKRISRKNLTDVLVPVPSLPEQKRIVAKIDAAFEKIDKLKANAERNLANAKDLFQSALDEAMRPKKGWVEKRLGEVCAKIGSGATPRGGRSSYCATGVSLIRSMNVYDHAFEYKDLAHISNDQANELDNVTIENQDVLINITGASVARCCVVPNDVLPARVNQHVAILRIGNRTVLEPEFLCYSLITPANKHLLLGIGEAGSTRQALTKSDLSNFVIQIPSINLQREIIQKVSELSYRVAALQQHYTRQIADCAEMRQSVLREAFEGRL